MISCLCWNISYLWNDWTITCTLFIDTIMVGLGSYPFALTPRDILQRCDCGSSCNGYMPF